MSYFADHLGAAPTPLCNLFTNTSSNLSSAFIYIMGLCELHYGLIKQLEVQISIPHLHVVWIA